MVLFSLRDSARLRAYVTCSVPSTLTSYMCCHAFAVPWRTVSSPIAPPASL